MTVAIIARLPHSFGRVPISKKINIFPWFTWDNKILTLEKLVPWQCNKLPTATCLLCQAAAKSVGHQFFRCSFVACIWFFSDKHLGCLLLLLFLGICGEPGGLSSGPCLETLAIFFHVPSFGIFSLREMTWFSITKLYCQSWPWSKQFICLFFGCLQFLKWRNKARWVSQHC